MKKKGPPVEEKGECAPLWIISFADMISLLMAFFVMLLTMSTAKSGKLCEEGSGVFEQTLSGFRESVVGFGVPEWFGSGNESLSFESQKAHYDTSGEDSDVENRVIDAGEEKVKQIFEELGRKAKTFRAQAQGERPNFIITPITFEQGQAVLNESGGQFLSKFAADTQNAAGQRRTIYVVGLAGEENSEKQRWTLSAKRAQAAADFLRGIIAAELKWPVYSWGAGTGGQWTQDSQTNTKSQILIGVLVVND
ncbi:MAG: OmpA family protein [Planctomycetota bacterium]|nr:OmpA family protein [Planctomycetota bacterium]